MSKPAHKPTEAKVVPPVVPPVETGASDKVTRIEPTADELLGQSSESDLQRMRDILTLADARNKAGVVSAEDAELVRIYNKGRRRFDHLPWQSHPGAFCTVPRGVAKMWLRDYSGDFVAGEDALKTIDGSAASLAAANDKIKQLEAELAAAKK